MISCRVISCRVISCRVISCRRGDWCTVALETEPLHSDAAVYLVAELGPLSFILNPRMVSALLRFLDVPPTHWQAVLELERSTHDFVVRS